MGVSAAIFESGGQRSEHYVPGVYSRSYNVSSPSGISAGNLCILGKSTGGEPFKLLEFGSLAEAQDALVGDELLDAIDYAFNASTTYIPQNVYAMRVNNGTRASITLNSGTTELLKIYAWDWGLHTNQLKMLVSDGTTTNSKKITAVYKDTTETVDDIINAAMSCVYYGEGQNPKVTVGVSSISFSAQSIPEDESEPETIDELTVSFDDFDTLSTLATRINNSDVWQVSVIGNNGELSSASLDTVSSIDVSDTGTTLYANYNAFVDALSNITLFGDVEVLDSTTRVVPDSMDSYEYFTGGTTGSYTIEQWQTALAALELEDIQIIATPSTDSAIHALISSHCTSMSNVINRKERTAILGGPVGMTDDAAKTEALGLNNKLVSLVCDNATKVNTISGDTDTLSGAMLGVMLAAMESAMSPSTPLTFKVLNVLGFTKTRTISNLTSMIKAGIMVCNPNPEDLTEYICIRALTTYQSDDLINNERSMVREDLYMNRDLRAKFKPAIGTAGMSANEAINILKNTAEQWATNGYIIPTDSNENVWDIKVKIDGDKIYITYSRYLTAPVNFVFITAVNHVYSSTVEM